MQPASITNNKILEPSGFGRVPLVAGPDIKVIKVAEIETYATYFLAPKHIGVLS